MLYTEYRKDFVNLLRKYTMIIYLTADFTEYFERFGQELSEITETL